MTPDDSVDAAELALGLLEGEERVAALRRMLADPAFAREVERWRDHFTSLLVALPGVTAPADIGLRLGISGGDATPWRWGTAIAGALAAGLALALVIRPAPVPLAPQPVPSPAAPPHPMTAAMAPAQAGTPFAAIYDIGRGEVRVAAGVTVPEGRIAQLWRIGADGVPHSLGLLGAHGTSTVNLAPADRAALAAGATLAISIEPPGGAPGPAPTGPVVATGKLERI